jgi:PAS domain S-box-containing protein
VARATNAPVEYRLRHKDGRWRHVEDRAVLRKDGGGKPVKLVGCTVDVTARKQAEAAARRDEQRRTLLDADLIGVMTVLEDGRILDANDAFLNLVGYTRDDLEAGRLNWKALTPPEALAAEAERVRRNPPRNGRVRPYEKEYVRSDGSRVPVLLGGAFLEGDGGMGVCFVLDITNRKQDENALRRRTAELEALLTGAPLGLAFFDRHHRFTRINDVLAAINGIPAADHLGQTLAELRPVNARTVGPVIDRVFRSGEAVGNVEVTGEMPARPGDLRHWLTGFFPVRGERGGVEAVGACVVDFTERKHAEERLQLAARATGVTLFEQDAGLRYLWLHHLIAGYTVAEIVGRTDEVMDHTGEDLRALVRAKREVLATGRGGRIEVVNRACGGAGVLPRHPGAEARCGRPGGRAARGGRGRDRPQGPGRGAAGVRAEVLRPGPADDRHRWRRRRGGPPGAEHCAGRRGVRGGAGSITPMNGTALAVR